MKGIVEMKAIKTQTKAAEYCGLTRWVLDRFEKKYPDLRFKDPHTGEYDLTMLDAVVASKDTRHVKALQSECIIALSEIKDPARLKAIKNMIAGIQNLNIQSQLFFEHEN
ncbi:MAG: hypothetical protein DRP56_08325 [Planctomycetota bacterium]|nr:MAG: hypothetical protein DRP56_08325 [Planctomycetota bacterium]